MHAVLSNLLLRARLLHRAWRYRLRVERPEILFMMRHLAPGQTALDVGAHKGAFTYWMQQTVGPAGRVVAFEPIPELAAYLRQVRQSLQWDNTEVVQVALSNKCGDRSLFVPESGHLGPTTFTQCCDGQRTALDVQTETLDGICHERSLRPVHFIKCDVEGHELEVFQGAERMLREDQPALLFECADFFHEEGQIQRVLPYLQSLGYSGHFFFRGELRPVAEFRVELHQVGPTDPDWCVNFAFLPDSKS
jgi:FkbM family methyltransferase